MENAIETKEQQVSKPVEAEPQKQAMPEVIKPPAQRVETVTGFLAGFVANTLKGKTKHGNYSVRKQGGIERLTYTSYRNNYDWKVRMNEKKIEGEEELAIRLEGGLVLSNANRMQYCGTHIAYGGPRTNNFGQCPAQATLEKAGAIPVPWNIFANAKLDISQAKVIEKAPAEVITIQVEGYENGKFRMKEEKRHYVGACLLEVAGNCFLFDIDREELKHKRFNAFVVKLPNPVKNIEDAYLSLKPAKVLMAEMEGLPVDRQGEWFFVKRHEELPEMPKPPIELQQKANDKPDGRKMGATTASQYYEPGNQYGCNFANVKAKKAYEQAVEEWEKAVEELNGFSPREGELRHGNNQPNRVELFVSVNGNVLVSGTVSHAGREHRDLKLQGWWEPVPNTAVQSWQVTGDID